MKPIFTVHAGEYLVGEHIESTFRNWNVWVPSKDTGIDLLVSNNENRKIVTLQVKFSKDFIPTHSTPLLQGRMLASGWWTHNPEKMHKSKADFWVFVLPSFAEKQMSFIILPPAELLQRLRAIHGKISKSMHSYLAVTKTKRCWDTRGLGDADKQLIAFDRYSDPERDFTVFLNAWEQVENRLA